MDSATLAQNITGSTSSYNVKKKKNLVNYLLLELQTKHFLMSKGFISLPL